MELLKTSSDYALKFAENYVIDELKPKYKYSISFNQSFDNQNFEHFDFYLNDNNKVINYISENEVIKHLFRKGKVPVWIDISVESVYGEHTVFRLLCAGRFTNDENEFYYNKNGTGPFGIKSPTLPPSFIEGQKFKLKPRVRKTFLEWFN